MNAHAAILRRFWGESSTALNAPATAGRRASLVEQGDLALGRFAAALVALICGMPLLVWFSLLRENYTFWLNDGGYPFWLRELVLVAYHPLFLASLAGCVLYCHLLMCRPPRARRMLLAEFGVLTLMVSSVATATLIDLMDNFQALF